MKDEEIEAAIAAGKLTRCPARPAHGAEDLSLWGQNRQLGRAGVPKEDKLAVTKDKRRRRRPGKRWKKRWPGKAKPGFTARTDFTDRNVYDMSVLPWAEEQIVIGPGPT